jgi:DNA-binding MarR family transcriptional regulator
LSELDRYLENEGQAGLFTRLARVGLLLDGLQHRILDEFGLRFVDFSVLRLVDLAGELSPGELAELTLRSTGGMTQVVDRLVKQGLVGRTPDAMDRRKVLVALTPKGKRLVDQAQAVYARERARVLGPLTERELHDVDAAIRRLLDLFDGEAAEEAAS